MLVLAGHSTFPLPLPCGERKGRGGRCGGARLLRSIGAETVATLFQRGTETYVLPATVPLTMMEP